MISTPATPIRLLIRTLLVACLLQAAAAWAQGVSVEVRGLNETMSQNVQSHIRSSWNLATRLDSELRRQRYLDSVRAEAARALRPWGFYSPTIDARLSRPAEGEAWALTLEIDPGPAVHVYSATIELEGPGAMEPEFVAWRARWPLKPGLALDQTVWEREKESVLDLAATLGYLGATFTEHRIELDLGDHSAKLQLKLDTGERALMGRIDFHQQVVEPQVLDPIGRFRPGEPYRDELVDQLRFDLWKTGYFSEIEVTEQPRLDQSPPVVDLVARLEPRKRDTHQVTLGYGTDTQARTQYNWTRHLLSERGDSLGAGFAWRQRYSEIVASGEYRLPRKTPTRQFWLLNGVLRRENQELTLQDDEGVNDLQVASGQVIDAQLKLGRLRLRDNPWSDKRIAETVFIDLLNERDTLRQSVNEPAPQPTGDFIDDFFGVTVQTVAVGMDWDWPVIRGTGFATSGHHQRAWWFTANEAWGSDKDFTQLYFSSRWNRLLGDDWKVLLRGEVGYTDAELTEYRFGDPETGPVLSVTDLPYRYSFKAGGSQSVRGYRYNRLSTNGVGSNHLLVASAELERRLNEDWSLAAFYDIGNAFNDWSQPRLKRGWGLGVRWYSLIGSVRADFGRAEDIEGHPWEFYLTIGTPLL